MDLTQKGFNGFNLFSRDPLYKDYNARLSMVPLKALSNQSMN